MVYEMWRLTGRDVFLFIGVAVMVGGVAATIWGARQLLKDARLDRKPDVGTRTRRALAIALIAACYPAAVLTTMQAVEIATTYGIEVVNESPTTVATWEIGAPGMDEAGPGPIAPGDSASRRVSIRRDGKLTCTIETSDGARHRVLVEGYVTNSQGGDARIVLDANGRPTLFRR